MNDQLSPNFIHHDKYFKGMEHLFRFIQAPPDTQTAIASAILIKNGITLLNGSYGTGKTQLVNLIKKFFFVKEDGGYDYDYETCHQDLTAMDVLYHLDLAELQKGNEIVHPKKIVTARLKFLNEIQRANPTLYNALLPLLSERTVTYRDIEFKSPDFILLMDQNPQDAASSEIPMAFIDRINFMVNLSALDLHSSVQLFEIRKRNYGIEWGSLEKLSDKYFTTSSEIEEIWNDVIKIQIEKRELLLANFLLNSFSVCIKGDRSNMSKIFHLDCESCKFKGEICSQLIEVPGQRALNSILKLSQGRAWLAKRKQIVFDDILFSLPYALSHRLNVKREELMVFENNFDWLKKRAMDEILKNKYESWKKAINYYEKGKFEKIEKIAEENLPVRDLIERRMEFNYE